MSLISSKNHCEKTKIGLVYKREEGCVNNVFTKFCGATSIVDLIVVVK